MSENFNESVLELASVISALVQDLTNSFVGEVESLSVLPENHTLSEDSVEKQNVKPTPGEQIAIQVERTFLLFCPLAGNISLISVPVKLSPHV